MRSEKAIKVFTASIRQNLAKSSSKEVKLKAYTGYIVPILVMLLKFGLQKYGKSTMNFHEVGSSSTREYRKQETSELPKTLDAFPI